MPETVEDSLTSQCLDRGRFWFDLRFWRFGSVAAWIYCFGPELRHSTVVTGRVAEAAHSTEVRKHTKKRQVRIHLFRTCLERLPSIRSHLLRLLWSTKAALQTVDQALNMVVCGRYFVANHDHKNKNIIAFYYLWSMCSKTPSRCLKLKMDSTKPFITMLYMSL